MNLDKYVKTDIDDGNGHIWLKFTNDSGNDTFACSQCGYLRRVDSNNRPLNKKCVGKGLCCINIQKLSSPQSIQI